MDYKAQFDERFARLNAEQKKAVTTTEGPVMVIAGPGTGKTEMLGARIAYILANTDTQPHNILCLTYTDAGRIAMRKRLGEFIGPDAYKVEIHTFHSFCQQVIQQNSGYFGLRDLELVSDLEHIEILESMVHDFGIDHALFQHIGYTPSEYSGGMIRNLKDFFAVIKSENWTTEELIQSATQYIQDLPTMDGFYYKKKYKDNAAGDPNMTKIRPEKEKMEKMMAAAKLLEVYEAKMKAKGRYDYQDMIGWVIEVFEKNPDVLARYQEQFLYTLVDEYQDTNGAQNTIIKHLIAYWDTPNVFIVGDDDQSIFRFQGANLRNIMDFYHTYADSVQTIVVEKNYRSSQNILDVAQTVIERNKERLVEEIPNLQKNLVAENETYRDLPQKPKVVEYYNPMHENIGVVQKIEALIGQGVDLKNIAILYKNHRQVQEILKILEEKNIPVQVKESVNILDDSFAQNILMILQYVQAESEDVFSAEEKLFKLLHFDFFGIDHRDIAMLVLWTRQQKNKLRAMQKEETPTQELVAQEAVTYMRSVIQEPDILAQVPEIRNPEALQNLGRVLSEMMEAVVNKTLPEVFEILLTRGDVLKAAMDDDDDIWLMRVLTTLFDFLKKENEKKPGLSVGEFLESIQKMKDYGIKLGVGKLSFAPSGVQCVTTHSSKGQEFEHVFVVGANRNVWDTKKRSSGIQVPPTMVQQNEGNDEEETRRLFFVAVTRAKKGLEVSYAANSLDGKELEPSQYVAEMREASIEEEVVEIKDSIIKEYHAMVLKSAMPKKVHLLDEEYLNKRLEDYRLSASHVNKYLKCPVQFYFEVILNVPQPVSPWASFGNAMHRTLEQYMRRGKQSGMFESVDAMKQMYEQYLGYERASFTLQEYERRLVYGKKCLNMYYAAHKDSWHTNILLEKNVMTGWDGIPINGKIDKIEFLENGNVQVVDYKTGSHKNATEKMKRPDEKNPNGGDYWRQMVFYKILLEQDETQHWVMEGFVFDLLEPNDKDEMQKMQDRVSHEDEATVKGQIRTVYDKIMRHEFGRGCGDCEWCGFVAREYKTDFLPKHGDEA